MKTLKRIKDLASVLLAIFLYGCPRAEVELPGDISGHVQDLVTEESIRDAEVRLFHTNDLIGADTTGMDGTFLFTNLESSNYSVEVIKENYDTHTENITVFPATTWELEIKISGVPDPEFSEPWLNFGMESTQLSFYISNAGGGILSYEIIPTVDWIAVSQESGEITREPDLIEVTIHKEGLEPVSHKAGIAVHSDILGEIQVDHLDVFVNYVMDVDSILYKTVRIGDQVWMAENLNTGKMVQSSGGEFPTQNNGIIEKLCYDNDSVNCDVLGGLYMWNEMMDYAPPVNEGILITQGICPEGWHVPTRQEWIILRDELGGEELAGGKLKDTSDLWWQNNVGASNESGFSGLPGGVYRSYLGEEQFMNLGERAFFWTTYWDGTNWKAAQLYWYDSRFLVNDVNYYQFYPNAISVRCVQDP